MSLALKRHQHRVEIRRQIIKKILQTKKIKYHTERQVNQTFFDFINNVQDSHIPKICAQKFQHLSEENQSLLINMIKLRKVKIDLSRPEFISLINKISLTQESILQMFFDEVISFVEKMIFSLKGNENKFSHKDQKDAFPFPDHRLVKDLMFFPNCLLQYWARFFAICQNEIHINSYCVILRSFIYWFGSSSNFFKHFNKYSLCLFMKNFILFENIYSLESNYLAYKAVQELHIKFRVVSMPLIGYLLEQGFLCDEFVEILSFIAENEYHKHLLMSLSCKSESNKTFFTHLMQILEKDQLFTNKLSSNSFFFSDDLDEKASQTLQLLSISSVMGEIQCNKVWQRKIEILKTINQFIRCDQYHNELLRTDLKWMVGRLFSIYIYCVERGKTTEKIQYNISVLVYNILLLIQDAYTEQNYFQRYSQNEQNQQKLELPEDQKQYLGQIQLNAISQSGIDKIQQQIKIFFTEELEIQKVIQKSQFSSCAQIVEFLSLLNEISSFVNNKQTDLKILDTNIIEKITTILCQDTFNLEQCQSIIQSLFEFLSFLKEKSFQFTKYYPQLQQIKNPQIYDLLSEYQQSLLQTILTSVE